MKLASAQINTRACDIAGNVRKIVNFWTQAEAQGVDLLVTPEQSVAGYPLEDMAANADVLAASQAGLDALTEKSKQMKTAILVGLPVRDEDGAIYNAAYIIDNGQRTGPIRKQHLPNYDVFDEKRIYSEGPKTDPVDFRGHRLGVAICEDIWHPDVVADLVSKGAEAIISPNASPFYTGKHHVRLKDVLHRRVVDEKNHVPLLYVNQVGGQDEIVFDGHSTAINADGDIMMMMRGLEEGMETLELSFSETGAACFQKSAIHPVGEDLEETWNALVLGLRDYVEKTAMRTKSAIMGMSGGIDSAVVAALAVDAFGPDHVDLYKLPSKYSSDHSKTDSDDAAQLLGCRIHEINIEPIVESLRQSLKPCFNESAAQWALDLADENLQARARGVILMGLSNANGGILLSTGNKSEVGVGYCTLYGDMNGGFNPLKDVPKTMVWDLARWRNAHRPRIAAGPQGPVVPQTIIDKPPSAELRPGQIDQDSLPPYPVMDDILERHVEQDQPIDDIIGETGYGNETVEDTVRKVGRNEFKRRQACPGIKITPRSFGKGRRVPIACPNTVDMLKDVRTLTL